MSITALLYLHHIVDILRVVKQNGKSNSAIQTEPIENLMLFLRANGFSVW